MYKNGWSQWKIVLSLQKRRSVESLPFRNYYSDGVVRCNEKFFRARNIHNPILTPKKIGKIPHVFEHAQVQCVVVPYRIVALADHLLYLLTSLFVGCLACFTIMPV